jgi:hypothetical protein
MAEIKRYLKDTTRYLGLDSRLTALEAKTANLGTVTDDYKGYIYLNELRRAGETDDNLALQRAKLVQVVNGFPIWVTPGQGSGVTLDDGVDKLTNLAINSRYRAQAGDYLIDAWSQASDTSGNASGPVNSTPLPNPNDSGNMWSGMNLMGVRGLSRIRRSNKNKPFIFTCNPVNTVATTNANGEDEQSRVFRNMRLAGLTFVANVQSDGYADFHAQVQVNAVDNFVIDNCESLGHRGDAFQIGNGHTSNGLQNRHNRTVIIKDTSIDGANQNNRAAIMVTDVDLLKVDNVHTRNCGKAGKTFTGTPLNVYDPNSGNPTTGSLISFQQNPLVTTSIMRNIMVQNCSATDGGAVGVALLFNANSDVRQAVNPVQNVIVQSSVFTRLKGGLVTTGSSYTGAEYNTFFLDNTVTGCKFCYQLIGFNGIKMAGNTFTDCERNGEIGTDVVSSSEYVSSAVASVVGHIDMVHNVYRRCGWANLGAFSINGCSGRISYNTFEDCGGADFSFRGPGTTKNLTIDQNEIINTNLASPVMTLTMPVYDQTPLPLPNSGKPDIRGESVIITYHPSNNLFQFGMSTIGARVDNFPKNTVSWRSGATVLGRYDAPRGEVEKLRKTGVFTGPAAADRWSASFLAGQLPIPTTPTPDGYVGPVVNSQTGAPPGVVVDDTNRLMSTMNSDTFWKSRSIATYGTSLNYPWACVKVAAPSLMTNGIMAGLTHSTDFPDTWIRNSVGFGIMKFGVHFDSGQLRLIVGGAFGPYVNAALIKAILGYEQVFLNVLVSIVYNINTGEGRVLITHPETKAEIQVASNGGSATGQSIYPCARFINANEFTRIYI